MHEVDGLWHKIRHMKLPANLLACRYVQYYADLRKEGPVVPKRLQLRRVTVTGLPPGDTKDLIVGVWSRPPGAGWKSHLMCLAAARSQSMLSNAQCICDCTSDGINDCRCRKASTARQPVLCAVAVVSAVRLHFGVTHMPDMHRMDRRNNFICHWLIEARQLLKPIRHLLRYVSCLHIIPPLQSASFCSTTA